MAPNMMTGGLNRMDRIRADLLNRARTERQHEDEETMVRPQNTAQQAPLTGQSRYSMARMFPPTLPRLFTRREEPSTVEVDVESSTMMPKSPDVDGRQRGPAQSSIYSEDVAEQQRVFPGSSNSSHVSTQYEMPVPPVPVAASHTESELRPTTSRSSDESRRRRRKKRSREAEKRRHPKRYLFCIPWHKSRRVRTQVVRSVVSGLFIAMMLAVYVGLLVSKRISKEELTIMILIIILCAAVFFTLSVIRLCILLFGPRRHRARHMEASTVGGYTVPHEPIRVVVARDEEDVEDRGEEVVMKPPAYGLWRESVRVDPDRLFWQRNEEASQAPTAPPGRAGPRPPSYISEDGVSYVTEAVPRSVAPSVDVPLPVHPSEVGRAGGMRGW